VGRQSNWPGLHGRQGKDQVRGWCRYVGSPLPISSTSSTGPGVRPKREREAPIGMHATICILSGIGNHSERSGDDRARLVQAIEAGRAARAEMGSSNTLTVPRKRELRRVIREGDEAARAIAKRDVGDESP
jgi:hypothetical protein